LGEAIRSVVDSIAPRAKAAKSKVKTIVSDGELTVCADSDKIGHVLRHLLDNAIKFAGRGGKIEVCAIDSGGEVTVAVKDDGPGIGGGNLEKVFDCFAKFETAQSGSSAGVGLGLTLAKGLIEMHGGRIWAESTVGEGSTFHFTLPEKL
jgi:signal transduction histidine kinase